MNNSSASKRTQVSTDDRPQILDRIERFLHDAVLELERRSVEQDRSGPGRPRILPALCQWTGLLVCVLRGFNSQLALWRLLTWQGLWFYPRFPVSDQALYKRLATAGTEPLERLFAQISALLRERLAPFRQRHLAPWASEVMALDETTLDPVARRLPALRQAAAGTAQLLPGKLAGLFDLRCQQWHRVQYIAEAQQNEKIVARDMVKDLPRGSLILADLGYFAFQWFDDLTDMGQFWISRLRAKTSYTVHHVYYKSGTTFDGIIWLGAHRADRAAHAVRLVCFQVGRNKYRYITNVLDPKILSIRDIAALYARRWDFEMAAKLIKRDLNLHLLWSCKTEVILLQIWAVLIIAQILHALQMEIAGKAGVDPFEVSLPLLIAYMPMWAYSGQDPVALVVERGREGGFIRPSRRTKIRAPEIPDDQLAPPPPKLELVRKPRYAQRKCGRGSERG